jgi:NADH:ubiquinone oxidoreductase subunit 5 (subunit L)/multisubunit Na+/H+ antiporter MnhA subunit
VAFSTLSQLGLMVYSYGLGLVDMCFFHLIRHAIFKALMFIVVGFLIFKNYHFQDLRVLSNLSNNKVFLYLVLLTRILSLRGFPFLVGFYSKDLIIENFNKFKILIRIIFFLSLFLTG